MKNTISMLGAVGVTSGKVGGSDVDTRPNISSTLNLGLCRGIRIKSILGVVFVLVEDKEFCKHAIKK